ncbi:MAG TPA: outer membrane protein assembly factor BamD [Syntrophales bacterium]|nr:outer membrane protein assembly factor BamD [Syntrophales bacterium]
MIGRRREKIPDRTGRGTGDGRRRGAAWEAGLLVVLVVLLAGCSWFRHQDLSRATPEGLYRQGFEDYQAGRYEKAIENFQRVREQHPLSPLALLAELGIADAHFSDKNYVEAEAAYTEFAGLHPTNDNLPYVLYQTGMCHYNQMSTIDRDQSETVRAQREFERLIARFPDSRFAFMAEKKLIDCRRNLAEQEFYVGRFYFRSKRYAAALKRFEGIARDYANLGLDYKVDYFLRETRRRLAEEEAQRKAMGLTDDAPAPAVAPTP